MNEKAKDSIGVEGTVNQRATLEHYEACLEQFGPTAKGMNWRDEASQRLRFKVLSEVGDLRGRSVHEVGAGAGHFSAFLTQGGYEARYSGSDISEKMVAAARSLNPGVQFECSDIMKNDALGIYDFVVSSGLFHVKLQACDDAWQRFTRQMLERMYRLCRIGIAFNLITDRVDFRNLDLAYFSPEQTLDFCLENLSQYASIRHDYPLYEFTVYVYRNARDSV